MKTWVLFDCNYLCHRARHSTGDLSAEGVRVGVIYGFLRDIADFLELFCSNNPIFCWDTPARIGHRRARSPGYKISRDEYQAKLEGEELEREQDFRKQVKLLQSAYLTELGYGNSLYADGYEADDIIAHLAARLREDGEVVIVSSDQDLYQLLDERVTIYNPHKRETITAHTFYNTFGIEHTRWRFVKALAGCTSDDIEGIDGVGEKTAIKYLCGELKEHTATFKKIEAQFDEVVRRNMPLIRLPYPDLPEFEIKPDNVTRERWAALADRLDMKSLRNRAPVAVTATKGLGVF